MQSLNYVNGGFMKRIMEKYGDYFVKYNRAEIQDSDTADDSAETQDTVTADNSAISVYNAYMQTLTETE